MENLFYGREDLDKIRRSYVKKPPYVSKKDLTEATKQKKEGDPKRNILRSEKSGSASGKNRHKNKNKDVDLDDGSAALDSHDPNYDSEVIFNVRFNVHIS